VNTEPVWWEKTIEYKFVLDAAKVGLQFAAPLSGVQERAGDGVFSADSTIILVEFKRSHSELDTEHDKFTQYETAAKSLCGRDGHHFLVYGSTFAGECSAVLRLHACNYFSRTDATPALGALKCGLEPVAFKKYLTELLALKKVDGRSTGTVAPEAVASAFGVSSRGASTISLSEYYRIALPSLYQALKPTSKHSTSVPGFGM